MKNRKRIVKSLALVALASTFAIAIAADSGEESPYSGGAYASASSASTSIGFTPSTTSLYATVVHFDSTASIDNVTDSVDDFDSGTDYTSASVSASDLDSVGGPAQASRAYSCADDEYIFEDYWSIRVDKDD